MSKEQKTGIVEKVEFTQGGAGNQWTTIEGVKYATYWDSRTANWKVGDRVTFTAQSTSLWHGQPKVPYASHIRKVEAEVDTAN